MSTNAPYLMPEKATVKINSIATGQTDTTTTELNKNLTYNGKKDYSQVITASKNLLSALSTNTPTNVEISVVKDSKYLLTDQDIILKDNNRNVVSELSANFISFITGVTTSTIIFYLESETVDITASFHGFGRDVGGSIIDTFNYACSSISYSNSKYSFMIRKFSSVSEKFYIILYIYTGINLFTYKIPVNATVTV